MRTDDTLRNTAAEENFTQTEVDSNASNVRQSPTQEGPHSSNTIDQRDNRPVEDYDDDEVINPSIYYIYHIMERYLEILYQASFEVYITFPHFEVSSLGTG